MTGLLTAQLLGMDLWQVLLVLLAGFWAGTINSVIGSGTLVTFPTLVAVGFPPVTAQVSNAMGLVASGFSGTYGYRRELAQSRALLTDSGRLVLLASDRLVVLEGLGPSVWLLLDEPRTAADVVACLRTEGPVPEDAEARVREAMDALVTAQLATAG